MPQTAHTPTLFPASGRLPAPVSPRALAIGLLLLVPPACAFGLWGMWPWLVDYHRRLEWWKVAGLWVGDLTTLGCFLWWAAAALAVGRRPLPHDVAVRRCRWTILTLALGMAIDFGFTTYIARADQAGYDHGVLTEARVVTVTRADAPYILDCRYDDSAGKPYRAEVRVYEDPQNGPPAALGVNRRAELRYKRVPYTIRIRYDPAWPRRCWVDGGGIKDASDLRTFSHICLLFQVLLLPLLWEMTRNISPGVVLVVRHELYQMFPLAIEACILVFFGLLSGLGRMMGGP